MVLTTEGEVSMADLSWQVGMADAVIRFPRHGLYIESDRSAPSSTSACATSRSGASR